MLTRVPFHSRLLPCNDSTYNFLQISTCRNSHATSFAEPICQINTHVLTCKAWYTTRNTSICAISVNQRFNYAWSGFFLMSTDGNCRKSFVSRPSIRGCTMSLPKKRCGQVVALCERGLQVAVWNSLVSSSCVQCPPASLTQISQSASRESSEVAVARLDLNYEPVSTPSRSGNAISRV